MSERLLFLIPARGGSKGLPGKNVLEVGGIPLVGRAARLGCATARVVGPGSRVVCSTGDSAIADAARAWGAEVPFVRPASLSSDSARSIDVVFHALDVLSEEFDAVVLLQPTSPLTAVEDVAGAIDLHRRMRLPIVSVCAAEHPAEWLFTVNERGELMRLLQDMDLPTQRQGARHSYRVNGAVYVSTPSALREHDSFFGPRTQAFMMPAARSIDVDTPLDLTIARAIASERVTRAVSFGTGTIGPDHPCHVIASTTAPAETFVEAGTAFVDVAQKAHADSVHVEPERAPVIALQEWRELVDTCHAQRMPLIATVSDEPACDALVSAGVDALKLPAGALQDRAMLRHAAQTGRPLFVSIGGAGVSEIGTGVDTLEAAGCTSFVLLHSVGDPSADGKSSILELTTGRHAFGVPVGFSSCADNEVDGGAAVVLGACAIELRSSAGPRSLSQTIGHIRDLESQLAGKSVR